MGCSKSSLKLIQASLKKQEKSQINNPTYHLKELKKEQQQKKTNKTQSQMRGNNKDHLGNE